MQLNLIIIHYFLNPFITYDSETIKNYTIIDNCQIERDFAIKYGVRRYQCWCKEQQTKIDDAHKNV